jgi:hypothetical protein
LYEQGYYENLNHYYTGINALSVLTIMIALAETYPAEWALKFNKQKEAERELEEWKEKKQLLVVSVQISIEAQKRRLETTGENDIWLGITEADFVFLTDDRPARITGMYKMALEGASPFHIAAVRRQVQVFEQLAIMPESVKAALIAIPDITGIQNRITHTLLFTGHMIDKPGRKDPRFPPEKEEAVYRAIKAIVQQEKNDIEHTLQGIAGGACGGDILFHEVCRDLGIATEIGLALPHDQFIAQSVQFAGPKWVDRFNRLYELLPHPVLSQTPELPRWLKRKKQYSLWERNNLWLLNTALVNGGMHLTLIALWDRKGGDGPGGTEHMVKEAQARGAKVIVIDVNKIR